MWSQLSLKLLPRRSIHAQLNCEFDIYFSLFSPVAILNILFIIALFASHFIFRKKGYWVGLSETESGDHQWVFDCTPLKDLTTFDLSTTGIKRNCFYRHAESFQAGESDKCFVSKPFICQRYTSKLAQWIITTLRWHVKMERIHMTFTNTQWNKMVFPIKVSGNIWWL